MGAFAGSRISTNGIIFAYDSADFRSYTGPAVDNVVTSLINGSNWSKNYCKNINLDDSSRGKPPGVKTPVVSFENNEAAGGAFPNSACFWYNYGNDAPQADNTQYAVSAWILTEGNNIQIRGYTGDNSETGRIQCNDQTIPGDGKWHRYEANIITTTNPNDSDSLSFRFYNSLYIPEFQRVWLAAPQMTPTSYHLPYYYGSRGSSNTIVDWTGSQTITTVGTVTHNSDLTFTSNARTDAMYLNCGNPSYPSSWSDSFSFEVWVLSKSGQEWQDVSTFGSNSGTCIIGRGGYNGSIGLVKIGTGGSSARYDMFIRTTNLLYRAQSSSNLPYDTYHHLVGTYDGSASEIKLYMNGVLQQTTSTSFTGPADGDVPDNSNLHINGNVAFGGTNGGYGSGEIPIARMYNRALTAREARNNFQAQRNRFGV